MIRRILLFALAALLVLGLAGGGLLYTRTVVDGADLAAPVEHGVEELAGASHRGDDGRSYPRGRDHTELSALLLPVPTAYHPGPDIGEWGNDAEIPGEEATAILKDSVAEMPREFRKEFHDYADGLKLEGVALRSYASRNHSFVAEISITAYGSDQGAADHHDRLSGLAGELDLFREGPTLDDYPDALCYLQPQGEELLRFLDIDPADVDLSEMPEPELDSLWCSVPFGPYHVELEAYGVLPLAKKPITGLLTDQLDHLEAPGTFI
ncbi:hypothetical protein [Streptomyces aidingensis]|uniref:Uncharacterized protein n=1 Tax=Streptomyces aidingensis TaxID=910347 RepID=A0A1I1HPT4_9ACTN|nr:hypothetical protein [Streptomyces aidingensis]SFC26097.1 hypothetical protein SAMN05421773_102481 [Streptomyces aidingensis]